MKRGTFVAFVAPSVVLMLAFIALPLGAVITQSFQLNQTAYERREIENCSPGFPNPVCTTETREVPRVGPDGRPVIETIWVGFDNFRSVLDTAAVGRALAPDGGGMRAILAIDFYKALRFTLTFTFVTLPLVLGVGLALALAVNAAPRWVRGPVIFVSLLPFIITPVIGSLSIRWLFVGDGILTRGLEAMLGHTVSIFGQGWSIEILMMFYRVWHAAPFAFVIFYAGLQTLSQDSIDAAVVDGASRGERLRYVILPHLAPLIVFVALIHLMDTYRVFDEIIGFASSAHVISLQWLTFHYLAPDGTAGRSVSRASASAMLTMIGIVILLVTLLRRTWTDHRASGARR